MLADTYQATPVPTTAKHTNPNPDRPWTGPGCAVSYLLVQCQTHKAGLAGDHQGTCRQEDRGALVTLLGWEANCKLSAPASHCCLLRRTPLLPIRLCHLLNCVMASLLLPSLAHAKPWCRNPAALQVRQHKLSFSWDSPASGDGHSVCCSVSSGRSIRGIRSVVRLITSSHIVMAS